MPDFMKAFAEAGVALPELWMPAPSVDLRRYAVIACDQFSAQPEYWERVEAFVGGAPSALRMTLPEAFLPSRSGAEIPQVMARYLADGTLRASDPGFVYLRRQTSAGVRRGLVAALDLEQYDFRPGWTGLIRATEGTVAERLPARAAVRRCAPLELPHVMVLFDDPGDTLFAPLEAAWDALPPLYDFELMEGGGRLAGRRAADPALLRRLSDALLSLREKSGGMLFAVGDGNHSFAAAKLCWEELKPTLTPEQRERHPARWALAELVNLRDSALRFEPIHRLLIGVDAAAAQREIGFSAEDPPALEILQPKLDAWLARHPEAKLEYIHGEESCRALGRRPGNLPVILPPCDKAGLFDTVRRCGALPRKSFSMGEARDKRYYLEARRITSAAES